MKQTRWVQRAATWILASATLIGATSLGGCGDSTTDDSIKPIALSAIKVEQAKGKDSVVFIDSRGPKEFAERHIPGAKNMQIDAVPEKYATPDPALTAFGMIVVYGRDPGSATARGLTKRMINAGYENLYWYMGGIDEWVRTGLPTEGTLATPQ